MNRTLRLSAQMRLKKKMLLEFSLIFLTKELGLSRKKVPLYKHASC